MLPRPLLLLVAMLAVSAATAKGVTAKIVISGDALAEPIVITDPEILDRFSIWAGPRSRRRVQGGEWEADLGRTYVDFPAGVVENLPPDMFDLSVEFYEADTRGGELWDEVYTVRYAMNPGTEGGYFFLPVRNRHIINHGVEGNWLHAAGSWEESVSPDPPPIRGILARQFVRTGNSSIERNTDCISE